MGKYNKVEKHRKEIIKKPGLPLGNPTGSSKNKDHSYIPPNRFYSEKEEVTLRFYQTTKALFKNPKYAGISLEAKLMYPVLLDKAEVLREVFNFLKEKKLTGEQTQELVRVVKSEPRFTTKESYNHLKETTPKKEKANKEPVKIAISEGMHLVKTLEKIKLEKMKAGDKEALKATLMVIKKKIDDFLSSTD